MSRAIFEPELEGSTIIFWEAGDGARVYYPTEQMAEIAHEFLIKISRWYHRSKETGLPVWVYGDYLTCEQFVDRFANIVAKAGYTVETELTRPEKEYW